MGWDRFLLLWCAVWGVAALVGYGMSLAGVTKAQRTVRLKGRIERVREPRHGGSCSGGISVVVSYRDHALGQEVTVTNDGERGEMITAAWDGREIGVSHPRGRPHAYRFSNRPEEPSRGLGRPSCALFLVYVGLVVLAAVDRGWPWALIGFGGPWAVYAAVHLPGTVQARNDRLGRPAAMDSVQGRIVAVLKDVGIDQDDGHTRTPPPRTAVMSPSTTRPPDPAEFTLDRTAEQRSEGQDVMFNVLVIVVLAATAVTGVVALL